MKKRPLRRVLRYRRDQPIASKQPLLPTVEEATVEGAMDTVVEGMDMVEEATDTVEVVMEGEEEATGKCSSF